MAFQAEEARAELDRPERGGRIENMSLGFILIMAIEEATNAILKELRKKGR